MIPAEEIGAMLKPHPVVQQNYFDFIVKYYECNRTGPNPEEVMIGVSVLFGKKVAKNTVYHHLKELSRHGKIELIQNHRKSVKIIVRDSVWKYTGVNRLTGWKGFRRTQTRAYVHKYPRDGYTKVEIDIPSYVNREQWLEYCLKKII